MDEKTGTMHICFLYILQGEEKGKLGLCDTRVAHAWVPLELSQVQGLVSCFDDTMTKSSFYQPEPILIS